MPNTTATTEQTAAQTATPAANAASTVAVFTLSERKKGGKSKLHGAFTTFELAAQSAADLAQSELTFRPSQTPAAYGVPATTSRTHWKAQKKVPTTRRWSRSRETIVTTYSITKLRVR